MADVQAAKRYAQAAFSIARDEGTIATWRSELADVATVLSDSGVAPMLADAKIPLEKRMTIIDRSLDVSPKVKNLAKLLVSKHRSLDARAVSEAFGRMADQHDGIAHAKVTTAIALTADQLSGIESQLSRSFGKTVKATSEVDPKIIGGIVVRVGDRLVDGSIRTKLKQLRRELEGAR